MRNYQNIKTETLKRGSLKKTKVGFKLEFKLEFKHEFKLGF